MKRYLKIGFCFFIIMSLFTSCATIAGGSKYNVKAEVLGHPYAKIEYNGVYVGTGLANFKVPRKDANKVQITVKQDGCEPQTTIFTKRTFRGWAFVGTLVTWTGLRVNDGPWMPIPFGVIVDGATSAWWKPNVNEPGIRKVDWKNYIYTIDYKGCP